MNLASPHGMRVRYAITLLAAGAALAACESRVGAYGLVSPTGSASGLTSLTVSAGALSPAFSPSVTSYTDNVSNATTSFAVTPTVSADASVSVNGSSVASGAASQSIPLSVGGNAVTIAVRTSGGTTKSYVVNVIRAA